MFNNSPISNDWTNFLTGPIARGGVLMNKSLETMGTRKTPQGEAILGRPDMVENSAGGYVWEVDDWMRLLGFERYRQVRVGYIPPIQKPSITNRLSWLEKGTRKWLPFFGALNLLVYSKSISPLTPIRHRWVTRKILPAKIARPSVGRGMRYDP